MSDGLSTINTANLTAAVKSVFQGSLQENDSNSTGDEKGSVDKEQTTSQKRKSRAKSVPKKRKTLKPSKADLNSSCCEVESAVISIPDHDSNIVNQPESVPNSASHVLSSASTIQKTNPLLRDALQQSSHLVPDGQVPSGNFTQLVNQNTTLTYHPLINNQQQLEIPAHVSPLTIKQLLSCISPLTVDGHDESHGMKSSIESLLLGQPQGGVSCSGLVGADMQLEPSDMPGHVQIPASLLHNLLQGISNPQLPGGSQPTSQSAPLPSIHHFTSQPLQTLLQNLLPLDSIPMLSSANDARIVSSSQQFGARHPVPQLNGCIPQVTYSMIGSAPQISGSGVNSIANVVETSAASILSQLASFSARESYLQHQTSISPTNVISHSNSNVLLREALQSMKNGQHQNSQSLLSQPLQLIPSIVSQQNNLSDNLPRLETVLPTVSSVAGNQPASLTQLVPPQCLGLRLQPQALSQAQNQTAVKDGLVPIELSKAGIQPVPGLPVLVQPAGPSGSLQLVPLDKEVSSQLLKDIVNSSSSNVSVSGSLTTSLAKGPVSILPKPSSETLEKLLQVVNSGRIVLPSSGSGLAGSDEQRMGCSYEGQLEEGLTVVPEPAPTPEELQADTCQPPVSEQLEESGFHGDEHSQSESTPDDQAPPKTSKFCVDCNRLMKEPCTVHNTDYVYMPDTPYLSRARASLPPCFTLQQTGTSDLENFLGVWCKGCLSERTKFGPVVGKLITVTSLDFNNQVHGFQPFVIETSHVSKDGEVKVLEMSDESVCNWTMFLRFAPSLLEQNCTVFRDGEEFYVVTKTEIKEEELLMWFSAEICYQLGISQNPGNVKLNQCKECGLYFLVRRLLHAHLKSKHPEMYNFNHTCYICCKKFKSKSKLNSHMAIHMFMKPNTCHFCQKQFADSSNLRMHEKIHTGVKEFKCEDCGKAFRQKAHLHNHQLVHTGEKTFKCEFCDKYFGRRADLKTHTYSHTHEKTFACTTCNKVFFKLQNLNKHLKVHSGERNYMCDKCFKGFQTKYHRDRHLKTCKETKDSDYMSLEEVAKLDHDDTVPLQKVSDDPEVT